MTGALLRPLTCLGRWRTCTRGVGITGVPVFEHTLLVKHVMSIITCQIKII